MALSMIKEAGEQLFKFKPNAEDFTLDEKLEEQSEFIDNLTDKECLTKAERVDLNNTFHDVRFLSEQMGFRDGFAAGIKFIMQAMVKE